MKNNVQSDIKIPKSGFKRSKFNWSHDINTTFGWGEVQPTECKLLVPNSKTIVNNKGLVRFAPMLDPTFGRVHYKSFSQFVPLEDVFPNLGSFLSREPVNNGDLTKTCRKLINAPLAHLSAWAFVGARATMYFAIDTNDGRTAAQNAARGNYITWYRQNPASNSTQSDWKQLFDEFQTLSNQAVQIETDQFGGGSNQLFPINPGLSISLTRLGYPYDEVFTTDTELIKLGCKSPNDLCPVRRDYKPNLYDGEGSVQSYQQEVTFDNADYVLEFHVHNPNDPENGVYGAIAFEFSDYGKRIRKIIQGCGYQLNLTSRDRVSLLPLLAQYKAYFDVFGLQLYQGWETTWAYKWIKDFTLNFEEDMTSFAPTWGVYYTTSNTDVKSHYFMLLELADEWYTDRPDFFGAHISSFAVAPEPDTMKFLSVDNSGLWSNGANIGTGQTNSGSTTSGQDQAIEGGEPAISHSYLQTYINHLTHSQVDATLLQRLTRWVNKFSLLGRAIDKILRAFGLGKYLDKIDSTFIGNTDKMLTISDVVSMAETDLATLGEYGGKGLEYFEEGKLVFENDVYGYWITLSCVIPEAGYTQNIDLTLKCLSVGEMYQADFDAIGFEATTKEDLVTSQSIATTGLDNSESGHTFGFVPRLSKWKVHKNLVNGDFNRHGLRSVYLPYTLDKQLNINDYDVDVSDYKNPSGNVIYNFVRLNKSSRVKSVPVAGNWARTPTKYAWLGNFDRIFRKLDDDGIIQKADDTSLKQMVGIADYNRDNFMFHCISSMTCWAPMKPIEESYQVEEDESPNQSGVEYVNKA